MKHEVRATDRARRALRGLPAEVRERVARRIEALADDPRPPGSRRLKGPLGHLRRLRVGDYRVGYEVDDRAAQVIIRAVGHRRDFYDRILRMP